MRSLRVLRTIGYDVNFSSAKGAHLYDREGRRYLDSERLASSPLAATMPVIAASTGSRCGDGQLVQMDVAAGRAAAERLRWLLGMERYSSAIPVPKPSSAIKCTHCHGRAKIVYCDHAFHGLTYGALSVNGTDVFRAGFGPLLGDCVPLNDCRRSRQRSPAPMLPHSSLSRYRARASIFPPTNICRKPLACAADMAPYSSLTRSRPAWVALAGSLASSIGAWSPIWCCWRRRSGGFVPVGAVAMKQWIFNKLFDRWTAPWCTARLSAKTTSPWQLDCDTRGHRGGDSIQRSANWRRAARRSSSLTRKYELKDVRGKGLIGLEFGAPHSFALKTMWHLLETANKGLFCQMVLIPLFRDHQILCQVSGPNIQVIKLLPSLVIDETDRIWIRDAFDAVIADCHRVPGAVWDLGRTLAGHSLRTKAGAA